jgi:hypothetical protein
MLATAISRDQNEWAVRRDANPTPAAGSGFSLNQHFINTPIWHLPDQRNEGIDRDQVKKRRQFASRPSLYSTATIRPGDRGQV